jgi:hypothetical protein
MNGTSGPILEMGCGLFSTVFLFWACVPTQRRLVTMESENQYYNWLTDFKNPRNKCHMDHHKIIKVANWNDVDLSENWSVAFVDHSPDSRRATDIARLTHADYVVVHDAEPGEDRKRVANGYEPISSVYKLFRYHYLYTGASPNTLILSNKYDLTGFHPIMDLQTLKADIPNIQRIVPETEMIKTHPGGNRRYTICRALREIYTTNTDPETRLKLRYACTLAEYVTAKVEKHDPGWLKAFYPFRRDWKEIMK